MGMVFSLANGRGGQILRPYSPPILIPAMRNLLKTSASLFPLLLADCNEPAPPPLVPVTKEFTAESRGLKFHFRYPVVGKSIRRRHRR